MTKARVYTDPNFRYVRSEATDIRKTFARVRRQMKEAEAAKKPPANVKTLPKKGEKGGGRA
jgi:hypothetical protein